MTCKNCDHYGTKKCIRGYTDLLAEHCYKFKEREPRKGARVDRK